ncbi:MAG: FAD:protein FMN transferase [Cytophagaceae bacterium]|jgi:thiamine biosynthesis lipoprotein|nr:FAD:protein FMN transferase [Cytophagaceae bacterium]
MRCIYVFVSFILLAGCSNSAKYIYNEGLIFGTFYHLTYEDVEGDLHGEIKELLNLFNRSLSTFDTASVISRFNRGEKDVVADRFFTETFAKAKEVHHESGGAFDITIAPIANAWGFGFEKRTEVTPEIIDSLMQFVGMDNVYIENGIIHKKKEGVMLNVSAIAKGYGVDVVAKFLKSRGIGNYTVEIGGEVATSGVNPKGNAWRIGINKPVDDVTAAQNGEYKLILQLSGQALATSGNYRNYYIKDGKKFAHTIDPRTGYAVQLSILSTSIVADDCMTADAYATACMVLGVDDAMTLIERIPNVEGCFIYELTDSGIQGVAYTDGFDKYMASVL